MNMAVITLPPKSIARWEGGCEINPTGDPKDVKVPYGVPIWFDSPTNNQPLVIAHPPR